ncbi:hypothetical protein [Streptomyces sp. NPDC001642]
MREGPIGSFDRHPSGTVLLDRLGALNSLEAALAHRVRPPATPHPDQ